MFFVDLIDSLTMSTVSQKQDFKKLEVYLSMFHGKKLPVQPSFPWQNNLRDFVSTLMHATVLLRNEGQQGGTEALQGYASQSKSAAETCAAATAKQLDANIHKQAETYATICTHTC